MMKNIVILLRPQQWLKNGFILGQGTGTLIHS